MLAVVLHTFDAAFGRVGFDSPALRCRERRIELAKNLKLVTAAPVMTKREVAKRWTAALVKDGFTPVSDYFLKNYHRLLPQVTSLEAIFLVHLVSFKWDEAAPFPGFKTLAKRLGVSTTAARGHARSLERKKYLRREKRVGTTNRFHLEPLFGALEKLRLQDERTAKAVNAELAQATA